MSRVFFSLRFRLLLLVLLACAPLVGLTLYAASKERRRVAAAWSEQSQMMAKFAGQEELGLRKQTRELLSRISRLPAAQWDSREACQKLLDEMLANHPNYANLAVIRTNGEVLASAPSLVEPGRQTSRKLLGRVLAGGRRFASSDYALDLASGKPTVTFGHPILDNAGQVQAMVVAAVKLEWLGRPRSELAAQLRREATWMEMDRNGMVLVCYPPWGLSSGEGFPDPALVKRVSTQPDGVVEARDADGMPAFFAFAWRDSHLVPGKVATVVSIPRQVLFAAPNQTLIRSLSGIGIATSVALILGWAGSALLLIRPVRALVRASNRLASGVLSSRTGLRHGRDELGQLTRTFDHMAGALEQREQERQLAEERLQTRDHMIRELPLVPAAICVCDQFGAVQLYNRTATELWGCESADMAASRRFCGAYKLFHPDGMPMPHSESPTAEVLRTGAAVRNRELLIGRPDGTRVPVLANVVPLRDAAGAMIGAVSCLQDITDRKRAEETLRESNERLQLLSRRLVESQETERRHIARELHDEVGQTLTVAEMNLQAAMQSARAASVSRRLKESLEAVSRVLEQVRDLSLNLRPSMLDDLGLESALRWYTNRQAELSGLQAEFRADALEHRLDPVIETACFRVAQEALTNVVRHARASHLIVELRRQSEHCHLLVRDDGAGFDVAALREQAVQGASLGLLSMEERATLVGGGIELKSAPGQGTEVHAWFPLKWRMVEV